MTKCYGHEECEYNAQPNCALPDRMECPHGVKADKPAAENRTDIRVENIRWGQVASEQDKAVERLQEENEKLRNSRDRWRKCAEEFSAGVNQRDNETEKLQTENEKLQAELEQEHAHRLHAEQHADAFLEDCKRLEAELEQVKRERDAIEQDFCAFTKQWLEEGSGFPCRWCKYENTGRCEWKESHPTYQDLCFGKFFEWRGPHKED